MLDCGCEGWRVESAGNGVLMNDWQTIVLAILGGGGLWQLILWLLNRSKDKAEQAQIVVNTKETAVNTELLAAEASKVQAETKGVELVYYQNTTDALVKKVEQLEEHVKKLTTNIENAQTQYEQRVGSLHAKMDILSTALERANLALDTANKTIAELRQRVEDGNTIITDLREQVTQLLVKLAEKK